MEDLDSLLADLQNTITHKAGSGGSVGGSPRRVAYSPSHQQRSPSPVLPAYQPNVDPYQPNVDPYQPNVDPYQNMYSETVSETKRHFPREASPPREYRSPVGNNLQELDTLLYDLNEARYNGSYIQQRPADSPSPVNGSGSVAVHGHTSRPSVDALLDELDSVPSQNARTYETRTVTVTESVPDGCRTASSATQELDDLMASLSDFKLQASSLQRTVVEETNDPPAADPAYAKPVKSRQLDSMLGNLQEDMNKQGITTTQKGMCGACDKPIVGQVITALGKTWHKEHFTCAHCQSELGNKNFFERDGRPYCEPDYHSLFSPRCAYCNGPILDKCVTALEQTWHPEHFFCTHCGQQFGADGFHEKEGKPYCRADYLDMFAPKCGGCGRAIMENYISALNAQWHPECFVCKDCQQSFQGGSFFDYEGQPYCETHYHAKRGSLCAGCNKPITGRCITAMFRKFHPEHFVCSFCLKQLNKGTFKEQAEKPYCHQCFDKLFG
ncbi:leupaxin-like isoform X2 [Amphibalanus amphitrite]|uniref:leupaxin-like isoform X2 n=1 Tax=Amphibalanus amphitrite TaxID=1232801 RepID=UPI001C91B2F0|nr:leupaxin-like isoform X2 [Amphibalanus amphitrite]XP_043211512.1 leupaxin-like isoform X2 [Amphibalanus amphitrite]XP_043211520.1 leupaxin-like isoform X2 [Amphibalanus amphitrite]